MDGQTPAGEDFRRTAPIPIHVQPMLLLPFPPTERYALPGETLVYNFLLVNYNYLVPSPTCFILKVQSSQGWAIVPIPVYCLNPNASTIVPVIVNVPGGAGNVVEQVFLTAMSSGMADTASVAATVRGWVTEIDLGAYPDQIGPDGHQSLIVAQVEDDLGWSIADGTEVTFTTSLGTLEPLTGTTVNGMVTTTLTSGASTGSAQVQATAADVTRMITVEILPDQAYTLTLVAADDRLLPDGNSTTALTAHVYDKYGDPAPDGSEVIFVVEGDEMEMGSVEGLEIYTATTSAGLATVTYRSGIRPGVAMVRAEIALGRSFGEGERLGDNRWAATSILLAYDYSVYLPLVMKAQISNKR